MLFLLLITVDDVFNSNKKKLLVDDARFSHLFGTMVLFAGQVWSPICASHSYRLSGVDTTGRDGLLAWMDNTTIVNDAR